MTTHDYDQIAAIVGEDKINALREAGVNIADKPTKPTTGLLGRWAKDRYDGDVLIISEHVTDDGGVWGTFSTNDGEGGTATIKHALSDLTFPEETTRPEDVPVGEAWLVNIDDGTSKGKGVPAVKTHNSCWATGAINDEIWWTNKEVTLITPLVPARPVDNDRECTPETVTTVQEYVSLPTGSIVAEKSMFPVCKRSYEKWEFNGKYLSNRDVAGKTRQVLRKGWGE